MKPVYFVYKMYVNQFGSAIPESGKIIDTLTDQDIILRAEEKNSPWRTSQEVILEAEAEQKMKRVRTTVSEMPALRA